MQIYIPTRDQPTSPSYFVIKVSVPSKNVAGTLLYLAEHDDIYLSPNTKLCNRSLAAWLPDRETAAAFIRAVRPTMERRHGPQVAMTIHDVVTQPMDEDTRKRIQGDAEQVLARIRTRTFAPNRRPL